MKRVMHIALHEMAIKDEDKSLKKIQNYRPGKEYKEIQAVSVKRIMFRSK
jgi:hypothetical protein